MPQPTKLFPIAWVERLFEKLSGMYGSRFADMWRGANLESVKAIWADGLTNYTAEEIRNGLEACKAKIWPPSLPEFLLLCRPLIDVERAWHQARLGADARRAGKKGDWPSKVVFWAYVEFGAFDLLNGAYEVYKKRWQEILDKKITAERDGLLEEIPEIVPQIAPPAPLSREESKQRLSTIKKFLMMGQEHDASRNCWYRPVQDSLEPNVYIHKSNHDA